MTHDELPEGYKPTNTVEVVAGAGRKYEQTRSMTHEELLARVKLWDDYAKGGYTPAVFQALRAVVELHKKDWISWSDGSGCECGDPYPCPTIQAIEKELM